MEKLIRRHRVLIEDTDLVFVRNTIKEIPWNRRLVGIKGSRGVGKTTLILQYIKQKYGTDPKALYVSLDDPWFFNHSLMDFTDDFVAMGGKHLFIDEVHKYANWAVEIKKIYDYHLGLKIVFTGSSLLEILNARADLSRRALVYTMQGLSFREFLEFRYQIKLKILSLDDILKNHESIALKIVRKVRPLMYFQEYLKTGYFPFYEDNEELYYKQINEIVNMIIELELPVLRKVEVSKIPKIKQLLSIISRSVPFKPNITAIAAKIGLSRKSLLEYIHALTDAEIIKNVHKDAFGISLLQKPEKIYLANTNYMFAQLYYEPNKGSIRETFFLNQLAFRHQLTYPLKGDFLVDDKYLFEIGGKNKGFQQIEDMKNAYIAADNMEIGVHNKIPLWMFGLMY